MDERSQYSGDRAAGAGLILAAAGSVWAMAHHPTGFNAGMIGGVVHGTMIALLLVSTWGFAHLALRLGGSRPLVLGGLVALAASLIGHIGAATINGFIAPAAAMHLSGGLRAYAWASNQALASLGVIFTGTAYTLWSVELLRRPRAPMLVAVGGLLAGTIPVVLLVTGVIGMDLGGASLLYGAQAAWALLVGIELVRGRLFGERMSPAGR